MNTKKLLR